MKNFFISNFSRKSASNLRPRNKKLIQTSSSNKKEIKNPQPTNTVQISLSDSKKEILQSNYIDLMDLLPNSTKEMMQNDNRYLINLHSLQDNNIVEWKCPYCGKWHNSKPHFETIAGNRVSVFTCDTFYKLGFHDRVLSLFLPDGHTFNYLCYLYDGDNIGTDPLCMRQYYHTDFIVNFYLIEIHENRAKAWNLPTLEDKTFFNAEFSIKFEEKLINHQEEYSYPCVKLYKRFLLSNSYWIDGNYCPYCKKWHTGNSCETYQKLQLPIFTANESRLVNNGQLIFKYTANFDIAKENAYVTGHVTSYSYFIRMDSRQYKQAPPNDNIMEFPVNLDEFYSDDAKHFFIDVPLINGETINFGIRFSGNAEDIRKDFF